MEAQRLGTYVNLPSTMRISATLVDGVMMEAHWELPYITKKAYNNPTGGELSSGKGTCAIDSLILYAKFRKVGAKRVQGRRQIEKEMVEMGGDPDDAYHLWVEVGEKVYDVLKTGHIATYEKTVFYTHFEITDTTVAEWCGLFEDELMFCATNGNTLTQRKELYADHTRYGNELWVDFERLWWRQAVSVGHFPKEGTVAYVNWIRDTVMGGN
jgi:hypothetical protein